MIPEIDPYNNYRGDGVATEFDYDFFIQNGSQLIVEKIDANDIVTRLEQDIDYEIVEIDGEYAGYIKFPIQDSLHGVLQDNEILSLQLDLPFHQDSEYGQSSLLDLNSLEFSLDYLTRLCQILKRQIERSVKVNEGSEATPSELLETINNNATAAIESANSASKNALIATEQANIATEKTDKIKQGQIVYTGEKEPTDPIYTVWISPEDNNVDLKIKDIENELKEVSSIADEAVLKSSLEEVNVVVETYQNEYSWYRVWSDGWIEQGGRVYPSGTGTGDFDISVTLLKSFTNTYYSVTMGQHKGNSASTTTTIFVPLSGKKTDSFIIHTHNTHLLADDGVYWVAQGY